MDKQVSSTAVFDSNEFLVSPYKVTLSALITAFVEKKPTLDQREIGTFCRLAIQLTQSLDIPYKRFKKRLLDSGLSQVVIQKFESKVNTIKKDGLGAMMDLIEKIKSYPCIRKSSILHLFVRRFFLYFDKLNFISVSQLYDQFVEYLDEDEEDTEEDIDGGDAVVGEDTNEGDEAMDPLNGVGGGGGLQNEIDCSYLDHSLMMMIKSNSRLCPKQMAFFISKQIKLIQVNEKKALNPKDLFALLKSSESSAKHNLLNPITQALNSASKSTPGSTTNTACTIKKSELNDINFLRYLNSLRVNEYLGAKESLFAYFDGISSQNNRCWAALNLAILHSHFNHSQLALEAIKECVSAAQEVNDEKCLENALLWIATVILKQKTKTCQDDEILALLGHLQKKALKLELSHLAAMASLHLEKLTGLQPKPKGEQVVSLYSSRLLGNPDVLAVKHSLTSILMMTYASRSALFTMIGASKLNFLMAQSTLHLHAVEPIGSEIVYHVNESTCIAIRNIALHLWKHNAKYDLARQMLISLGTRLFSEYNSSINSIWKQAVAEIEFEKFLYCKDFGNALKAINAIRVFDPLEGKLRLAEYKLRRLSKQGALVLIEELLEETNNSEKQQRADLTPFTRVRALLLKSKLLQNISILFEAIELSRLHNLKGLEISCKIELAEQILELGQVEQARRLLDSVMIPLLSDGSCHDIGRAFYLEGRCLKSIHEQRAARNESVSLSENVIEDDNKNANDDEEEDEDDNDNGHDNETLDTDEKSEDVTSLLVSAISANSEALGQFELIGDKDSVRNSCTLQAHLYHALNNNEKRNFYARKARLLLHQ